MVLPEIDKGEAGSPEFAAKAKVLKDLVEHHAGEEEKEMFPRARKLMDKDELQTLGEQLARRKRELKARRTATLRTRAARKRTTRTERAHAVRRGSVAVVLAMAVSAATPVAAEPVKVRLQEGNSRGFLALRPPGGDPLPMASWVRNPRVSSWRIGSRCISRTARSTTRR